MGIKVPEYHLQAKFSLPQLRKRLYGDGKRSYIAGVTLTSLIDMFATILFYLILSFSATGEIFLTNDEIKLPQASYGKEVIRAPIITVFEDKIVLEGSLAGSNEGIIEKEEFKWELPLLAARLNEYKKFFENVQQGVPYPGDVIVQADKDLSFLYIKRVMYTLVKEGFGNINFVALGQPFAASVIQD